MTFWDLVRVLVRYWVLVILGVTCTMAAAHAAMSDAGVYYTRTELVFLAPTSTLYPNALRTQSEDVIDTAGVVAKRVMGPGRVTKFSSPDVNLIGLGVRDGWSLRLPDTGGQWASNFATQRLLLDVVGPSRPSVEREQTRLIARVRDELHRLQRDAEVRTVNDITMMPAPESTVIYQVKGNRPRAVAMTGLLGVGGTLTMVLMVDRLRSRRRDRASSLRVTEGQTRRATKPSSSS